MIGLLVYLCTTAALDDCQVYLHRTFDTMAQCETYRRDNRYTLSAIFYHPIDLMGTKCDEG